MYHRFMQSCHRMGRDVPRRMTRELPSRASATCSRRFMPPDSASALTCCCSCSPTACRPAVLALSSVPGACDCRYC